MALQSNLTDFLEGCSIDDRQVAATGADVDASLIAIDPNGVGVVFKSDLADRFKLRPAERRQNAITAVRYVQRLGFRDVCDTLRLIEPLKPADDLPSIDVDDTDGVVPQLGDEQPPPSTSIVK